uniref:Uncharacterized protein n=1 Tax=uncultured bacterium Contigcl_1764b TaxID=1393658 RepID=W0FT06_9BACT|nr:hypothetical protein [uncultured bacterium Contigcl_1764b]
MKKRSLIVRLIPWIVALAAIAALIFFVFVPIYSVREDSISEPPEILGYEGDGAPLKMENDALLFEMDAATTQFTVTDKKTGKVWYSNPENRATDPIALSSNKDALSATLNVTYTFSGGEIELNNYTYSMENQTFRILPQEDGSIRVDYAIGKIEKKFLLPTAITVERYKQFTDAMSKKNKKQVSSNYSLYESSKLDKKDNKDEIIAMYPSVVDQDLYIMKADTTSNNKAKIEGYFKEAGYTEEDLEIDQQLIAGERSNNGPVFNASMIYRLDGEDLVVEVPYDAMRCEDNTPLTYVSVLPMFGAAGTNQEGYMLLPEGGGALINYNNGKLSQSAYYANLYGWDYATERTEVVSETENAFPVFGMGQEDGSFICIIEGASSYAGICADISGRFNSYNYIYSKYNVLHYDRFNVSNRTAQLLYMYEKDIPDDTIVQRYHFLAGNNYADMAHAYGDYLRKNPELKNETASEETPVNVELIGAINKVVSKAGFPVDSVIAVTKFDEAADIIHELTEKGVRDLHVRMEGWCNGGVRQKVLTGIHVQGELGGEDGMKKLISSAKSDGASLSFDGISCFAYNSGIFDGFAPFSNAARFTTREQVKLYNYDIVTYQQSDWQDPYYLVRPEYASKCAENLINGVSDRGAEGVAFRDIGNLLSADYYVSNTVTREMVKQVNVQTLRDAVAKGLKITIKEGNDYAIPYADMITDMNLSGNAYAIIDRRIPFYQIAIHGMKNYTGESINLAGDYHTALLECAEYGAGLNFTFMKADTEILQDTMYSSYTAGGYDRWKDEVIPMILRYQQEMKGLNRQQIVRHDQLSDEVSVTEYQDGTKVYVNYSDNVYKNKRYDVSIPARDYVVERGNGQ